MMNDYVDYYNYINNLNQMNNQIQNNNQKMNFAEPYIGFTRGNMFDSLYDKYQNYRPQELNPSNEKEYSKLLLQMYSFAAHDLSLYLDVYPNDINAIRQRNEYIKMYNEALRQYESNYGAITKNSLMLDKAPWGWDTKKWPWEGMK